MFGSDLLNRKRRKVPPPPPKKKKNSSPPPFTKTHLSTNYKGHISYPVLRFYASLLPLQ